jgi:ribulose-bisphosphate carboxylase large chain
VSGRASRPRGARHAAPSLRRQRDFRWRGVEPERYKDGGEGDWGAVTRHVLFAGSRGAAIGFDVRYFEIARGGHSTLERHRHAHVVIAVRGVGRVRLGRRWHRLRPLDSCYIEPHAPHQLRNDEEEPFGFLCVVDARRDRGVPLDADRRRTRGEQKHKRRS